MTKVVRGAASTNGEILTVRGPGGLRVPHVTTTERDAISSPSNGLVIYNTSNMQLEAYENGAWAAIGSGGGGGGGAGKNYFDNPSFNNLEGVTEYDDSSGYVDGTGGSPSVTSSNHTGGSVIEGSSSLQLNKPGSDVQNQGWTLTTRDIDRNDAGKPFYFEIWIDASDGQYTDNELEFRCYDVGAAAELPVTLTEGADSAGSIGVVGDFRRYKGFVQTSSSTTGTIRLSLHYTATDDNTITFYVDQFSFGPPTSFQELTVGNITDWQSYTPTTQGLGTVTVNLAEWRQVGDTYFVRANLTLGTVTASEIQIGLPNNVAIDTGYSANFVGYVERDQTAAVFYPALATAGDTYFNVGRRSGSVGTAFTPQNGSTAFTTGDVIEINASVRVTNASSNIQAGTATTFRMGPYLENGTRVTGSAPAALGEYRSYLRQASARTYTETNGDPSAAPSAADGVAIYSGNGWTSADTNNQPTRYEIFVGTNKQVKIEFYQNTGKTGVLYTDATQGTTGLFTGCEFDYDPTTGIASVLQSLAATTTTSQAVGRSETYGTVTDGYFDIIVSENVQAIGFEAEQVSEVWVIGGQGFGGTNTNIRRWTTTQKNAGSAITYADDATNGGSFTINDNGLYAISVTDNFSASETIAVSVDISANTAALSLSDGDSIAATTTTAANEPSNASTLLRLTAGQVLRLHKNGAATDGTNTEHQSFRITKVAN